MRILRLLPLLLLVISCAQTASIVGNTGVAAEGSTEDFDVSVEQANAVTVFPNQRRTDIRFNITIANRTQEPYTIKRVMLQSMSGRSLVIPVITRTFDESVAPGAKTLLPYWAVAEVTGYGTPREPMTLRTTIEAVDASGAERLETFTARINGQVQFQISNRRGGVNRDFMQAKREWIYDPSYSTIVHGPYGLPW